MQYLTVEQSIRKNGNRHLERAIAYASAGYSEQYYQGSMKKALKNFKLADEFANYFKIDDPVLKSIGNILDKSISDAILYGTSFYRVNEIDGEIKIITAQDIFK